jgi:N-glycosylase/DNA lyase
MIEKEIDEFDLGKIEESGQCFRLRRTEDNVWENVAGNRFLRVERLGEGRFGFSCTEEEFDGYWKNYFDLGRDYRAVQRLVPDDDAFLRSAVSFGDGIRILRQEPFEMLITFIISQRKNIPAIRRAVETLCDRYGEPIDTPWGERRAFPTAERLASCADLSGCSLGYREKYVLSAARDAACGKTDVCAMSALGDEELKAKLKEVYGVGEKVANCVMLFGYGRLGAFPRDVWINRVLSEVYGDAFDEKRYAGVGGIIQQYMFFFARSEDFRAFCA